MWQGCRAMQGMDWERVSTNLLADNSLFQHDLWWFTWKYSWNNQFTWPAVISVSTAKREPHGWQWAVTKHFFYGNRCLKQIQIINTNTIKWTSRNGNGSIIKWILIVIPSILFTPHASMAGIIIYLYFDKQRSSSLQISISIPTISIYGHFARQTRNGKNREPLQCSFIYFISDRDSKLGDARHRASSIVLWVPWNVDCLKSSIQIVKPKLTHMDEND